MRSSHIEFADEVSKGFEIEFRPRGIIHNRKKIFYLILGVSVKDKENRLKIEVNVEGQFKFENREDERIEDFLYLNAPAILFPYIRAYINTLSSLSGNRPIVLPTLNLSGMRENLKKNTTEVDE